MLSRAQMRKTRCQAGLQELFGALQRSRGDETLAGMFSFLFPPRRASAPPTRRIHLGEVSALR